MSAASLIQGRLCIVAGGGEAPRLLIAHCRKLNINFFVLALKGQADTQTVAGTDHAWVRLGAGQKIFDILKKENIKTIVMLGWVRRPTLWQIRPDWFVIRHLPKLGFFRGGDNALLTRLSNMVQGYGFCLVGAHEIMPNFLAPPGVWGRHLPDDAAQKNITEGLWAARRLGARDVGQAVVICNGEVKGIEGPKGTRGLLKQMAIHPLKASGGVLIKAKKPQQDDRFDLPSIGPKTVAQAKLAGLAGIAVEAGAALVMDREATIAAADEAGLFLVGIHD